jgi:lysophospholipase L1-like esterase
VIRRLAKRLREARERHRHRRVPADVVMLGDSLTQEGSWHRYFPGVTVINRGVGGNTTQDVVDRLDTVFPFRPRLLFVLVGINDLNASRPRERTLADYETLLIRLRTRLPATAIFVQSVLPVNGQWPLASNDDVRALNVGIQALADRYGATFVPLGDRFVDGQGELEARLSPDGLHLNEHGYQRWCSVIEPLIRRAPGVRFGLNGR